MTKNAARLIFPESRLASLLRRGHGRLRSEALAAAALRVQAQQGMAMAAIAALIAELEARDTVRGDLEGIGRDADRIVTLAQMFEMWSLADAARRLCDLVVLLQRQNRHAPDALAVHIQALRLFAPDSPLVADAAAALVLGRIAALAAYLSSPLSGR